MSIGTARSAGDRALRGVAANLARLARAARPAAALQGEPAAAAERGASRSARSPASSLVARRDGRSSTRRGVTFARALPPWLVDTFNEITDFGKSGWFLVPLGRPDRRWPPRLAPLAGRIANLVLARLVVRLRYLFLAIARAGAGRHGRQAPDRPRAPPSRRPDRSPISRGPGRHEYASLPSGHTTTAFAAAVAIAALWPKARTRCWSYAVIIAVSRVVITAHFVSDVVAAAFVGAFGAILVRNWFAARGLVFVPDGPDGAVHAEAGPVLAPRQGGCPRR